MTESSKPALRTQLRAARDGFVLALAPGERTALEAKAADHLLPLIADARCVAFYMAVGSEISCDAAIAAVAARGIAIALPHVDADGAAMDFRGWRPDEPLVRGWRGLRQPGTAASMIEPDVVIVPMLGFDSGLGRVGQGGGFYDRALAARRHAKKIGFAWGLQQLPAVPVDPWDERLDRVVTERGVIGGTDGDA